MATIERIGVLVDYETRSRVDLLVHGNSRYARDLSTEVLCLCAADVYFENGKYMVDRASKRVYDFRSGNPDLAGFLPDQGKGEMMFAFNAGFEYLITTETLGIAWPIKAMYCVQLMALYNGLPASLDEVSKAAPLKSPKDEQGHRLMLRMCKPDKATGEFPYSDEMMDRLIEYCRQDIEAEAEVLETLRPVPAYELSCYHETLRMNMAGLPVDLELAVKAIAMTAEISAELQAKFPDVNMKSSKQIKDFTSQYGYPMTSTDKEHVAKALQDPNCPEEVKMFLEVKAAGVGSSSVSKFDSVVNFTDDDGMVRNAFRHHGAVRTGRWTSQGVQLQNLPRGEKRLIEKDKKTGRWLLPEIREYIRAGDYDSIYLVTNGRPMDAMRSVIRSLFAPAKGKVFVQRDLAAIEARGAFWFARAKGLQMFHDFDNGTGKEPYMIFADALGMDRFSGKAGVLSVNYGIGWKSLQAMCELQGKKIKDSEAEAIINLHREMFPEVKQTWDMIKVAIMSAFESRNTVTSVDGPVEPVKFIYDGNLRMRLPSGRVITYWDAKLQQGDYGPDVTYMTHGAEGGKAMGWHRTRTWAGSVFGHIVQGFSACIMRDIALRMTEAGIPPCLLVHDEAVTIADELDAERVFKIMGDIMKNPPAWAKGMPVQSAGYIESFYLKG